MHCLCGVAVRINCAAVQDDTCSMATLGKLFANTPRHAFTPSGHNGKFLANAIVICHKILHLGE